MTEVHKPAVRKITPFYQRRLYEYNGYTTLAPVGNLYKIRGHDDYNRLLDINALFSSAPWLDPIDRTGAIKHPLMFAVPRAWRVPTQPTDLESALQSRVMEICAQAQPINIFWSGGIDSTTIVVAFMTFAPDSQQIRILYSPWSQYEHPDFFHMLQSRDMYDMIDLSGERFLDIDIDGLFVTGNTGDELHGSIDETFFNVHGYNFLHSPWRDFFYKETADDDFMDFCESFFKRSGRDIDTVLEARWWFYANTKLHGMLNFCEFTLLTTDIRPFDPARLIGFFDCEYYERFVFFNVDRLLPEDRYACWRQFLKDFCCRHDGFEDWRLNKTKWSSAHTHIFNAKKIVLNNTRHLLLLEDGCRVSTQNLPLFSREEWEVIAPAYSYLFHAPNGYANCV